MSEKEKEQTKITPAGGQADDSAARQHAKKEQRTEAKSKDENKGHGAHKKKADESSGIAIKSSASFLKDVVKEAKKITWPPRAQVFQETWSVIVLVTFITVMVLGFDYALGSWVFGPIEHFAKVMAPQTAEQGMFSTEQQMPPAGNTTPLAPGGAPPVTPDATTPAPPTSPSGAEAPVPTPTTPATTPPAGTVPGTTSAPQATPPGPGATTPSPTSTTPAPAPQAPTSTAPATPPTSTPAPASTPTTPRP